MGNPIGFLVIKMSITFGNLATFCRFEKMDRGPSVKIRVKTKDDEPQDEKGIQILDTPSTGKIQIEIMFSNMNIVEPEKSKTTEEIPKVEIDNVTGVKRRRMSQIAANETRRSESESEEESGDETPRLRKQIRLVGLKFNPESEDIGTQFQRANLAHIDQLQKFEDAANPVSYTHLRAHET